MPEDFDPNAIPETADEAEQLIEHFHKPSEDEGVAPQRVEAQAPSDPEFGINYRGKEEKYPLSKIIQFAQQGRDYNEKMRDFRVQRETWDRDRLKNETKWKDLEGRLQRYSEVEEYNKKDPMWWDHVVSSYKQKMEQGSQGQSPNNQLVEKLMGEIGPLKDYVTQLQEREKVEKMTKEDEGLDLQVREYKDKYPNFDWNTLDIQGKDLERQILQHAIDNEIKSFKAAANDYLHDEFLKRTEFKAKEDTAKDVQKVSKLGLGAVTDKRAQNNGAIRTPRNWDEAAEMAKASLGLT